MNTQTNRGFLKVAHDGQCLLYTESNQLYAVKNIISRNLGIWFSFPLSFHVYIEFFFCNSGPLIHDNPMSCMSPALLSFVPRPNHRTVCMKVKRNCCIIFHIQYVKSFLNLKNLQKARWCKSFWRFETFINWLALFPQSHNLNAILAFIKVWSFWGNFSFNCKYCMKYSWIETNRETFGFLEGTVQFPQHCSSLETNSTPILKDLMPFWEISCSEILHEVCGLD